jgi:hypothetical protein
MIFYGKGKVSGNTPEHAKRGEKAWLPSLPLVPLFQETKPA